MSTVRTFDYSLLDREPHRGSPQALQVFTGNQVDPSKVDAAYEELRDKTSIPSGFFWIDMERVAAHLQGDVSQVQALREYLPKTAASLTFDYLGRLLHLIPEVQRDSVTGFEFWFHCISEPVGMANLHVDNDPPLALGTGKIRVPLWGGILYLGPHDGIQGGGTMFNLEEPASAALLQKCMSRVPFPELSALSSQWVTVPLLPGRIVVFRGTLPHCMAETRGVSPTRPRINLLANLWAHRPTFANGTQFCRLSPSEFALLSRFSRAELDVLAQLPPKLTSFEEVGELLGVLGKLSDA
jgi:hypothetical protein